MSFFVPVADEGTIDPETKQPIAIASQEDFNKAVVTAMRSLYLALHLNDLAADSRFRSYLFALDHVLWGWGNPNPQPPTKEDVPLS